MDIRYKVILSNALIYREIQIPAEVTTYRIGTELSAQVRLHQEDFFERFELSFDRTADSWQLSCSENLYISLGDVRKLMVLELRHGSGCIVSSQKSGQELFKLSFMIDFDYEEKIYDAAISMTSRSHLLIGTAPECDIVLLDSFSAFEQVELTVQQKYLQLNVRQATYGVQYNGVPVEKGCRIKESDFFSIANFSFYYRYGKLYLSNSSHLMIKGSVEKLSTSESSLHYPCFNRNTKISVKANEEPITILNPSGMPQKPQDNLMMSLMPSIAMLILVIVVRGFMSNSSNISYILFSVCSMSLGIATSVVSYFKGKKDYKKDVALREEQYQAYIQNKRKEIEAARSDEVQVLNEQAINEQAEVSQITRFDGSLFDRSCEDSMFLSIRLGSGSKPAKRIIEFKKKEQIEPSDSLEQIPEQLVAQYKLVNQVPIICDLKEAHNVGIIGTEEEGYNLLKVMTLDICAHHYFKDVKLFFIFNEKRANQLSWIRFLPHVQNDNIAIRNIICDEASKTAQFEYLYKELSRREQIGTKNGVFQSLVVFLLDDMGIKKHPISRFLKAAGDYQVYFISFEQYAEQLPMYCRQIIRLSGNNGMLIDAGDHQNTLAFTMPSIDDGVMQMTAQKLAPIYCEEISLESALTKNITLFQLFGIFSVEDLDLDQRWAKEDVCKTMAAPMGVRTKNEIVCLDLHEKAHGPHGLVAGTTGSGKSEILQTYILSMATLFSPYEVAFVIIDFKGGGMANQFRQLPHLLGAITDIDGKEINRSLLSIRAELDRRKELFALANVNNINQYIRKYQCHEVAVALPHLIIIVDEFAELKAEQPEFMKELISASRIGRSLGVHLILATQKPAGQVSDQIWSNSKFKLCLKVQTKEDSNEVIKSPLAAEIVEPGRAYLQVGNNEIFELFQSAYSGAPEKTRDDGGKFKSYQIASVSLSGKRTVIYQQKQQRTEEKSRSQLEAIVSYVENYCAQRSIEKLPNICLPPLPEVISCPNNATKSTVEICAEIGIYDAPSNQYQGPVKLTVSTGNTLIIGASQYGKTNLLQTILRQLTSAYTPEEVNLYVLDFGSMFLKNYDALPHVGGVVCAYEEEKFKNLFKLLEREVVVRKDKLVNAGVSSFAAYREAGYTDLPQIVLMIDNFTALKETYFSDVDQLLPLCRDGLSVGLSVVIANTVTSGFGYRYFSTISNSIALHCNEGDEINTLFGYCKMRPSVLPGRCLIQLNKAVYEAQTYLAFEGKREIDRSQAIKTFVAQQQQKYPHCAARRIPEVPEILTLQKIYDMETEHTPKDAIGVALDYESIESVVLPFDSQFMLALVGANTAAKQRFLNTMMLDLRTYMFEREVELYMIDSIAKPHRTVEDMPFTQHYSTHSEDILEIIESLEAELAVRNDMVEMDGINALDKKPLALVVINSRKALEMLMASKTHMKQFDNISKNYRNWKILFVFADIDNAAVSFNSGDLLKRIRDERKAMLFTSLKDIKFYEIQAQTVRKKNAVLGESDAFYLNGDAILRVKLAQEVEHES